LAGAVVGEEPDGDQPLRKYGVRAPGVCAGRPAFKYTRMDVRHVIGLISGGWTVE